MSFLLVHGAGMDASCWDLLVPHLGSDVVAVDLPGRGSRSGEDLRQVTLDSCAEAIVAEAIENDLEEITVVAHSFAGVSVPRAIGGLNGRLKNVIFLSAVVPSDGTRVLDGIDPTVREAVESSLAGGIYSQDPAAIPAMLCNDMDTELTDWTVSRVVDDAAALLSEPVDLAGLKAKVPRTYVRLTQDACYVPELQGRSAQLVGGSTVFFDSGHMPMVSQPEALARLLNELATI